MNSPEYILKKLEEWINTDPYFPVCKQLVKNKLEELKNE
jgi:hypothetical protein